MSSFLEPPRIFGDNSSFIIFLKDNKVTRQSKFINIKYLVVWEQVRKNEVYMVNVSTHDDCRCLEPRFNP